MSDEPWKVFGYTVSLGLYWSPSALLFMMHDKECVQIEMKSDTNFSID